MVGISFKISKTGTRYISKQWEATGELRNQGRVGGGGGGVLNGGAPKRLLPQLYDDGYGIDAISNPRFKKRRGGEEGALSKTRSAELLRHSQFLDPLTAQVPNDAEASFAVNLFPDGFAIDKPTEKGKQPPLAFEVMELLLPYDRTSETFLRAIDGGWLPDDLLEEIPCKYINGCVVCELRDYRDSIQSVTGDSMSSLTWKDTGREWVPLVHRVLLQPSTETIVKDISSMADDTWTYKDFLEVEARVLKAFFLWNNAIKHYTFTYKITQHSLSMRVIYFPYTIFKVLWRVSSKSLVNSSADSLTVFKNHLCCNLRW